VSQSQRVPVLVGIAQVEQRLEDPAEAKEPLELMLQAVAEAAEDAGAPTMLSAADSVRVIGGGTWNYENPARIVAERIGVPHAQTVLTSLGGNCVQVVVNRSLEEIQSGQRNIIVITGAECGRTQGHAAKAGLDLPWALKGYPVRAIEKKEQPDVFIGSNTITRHEAELKRGINRPIQYYPIFENALRYAKGESIEDHIVRVSELWAGFNHVATKNPHAWIRTPMSAEEIRTPSPENRLVSFPYPKLMNSNLRVDQGAALILTSVETARKLGISNDRMIYSHGATEAWDHLYVSERDNLHSSPGIRIAGQRLFEIAEVGIDDLEHIDLYSCFPSAVQVAAQELGIPVDQPVERPLTVTGGLTFAGGPLNNYVMHGIARTAELLRGRPGTRGLVTANGGMLTQHALCIYSATPPEGPFRCDDLQDEVDATPRREPLVDHEGPATLESYVVMYGRQGGAETAHAACLTEDGRRTWANTSDPDVLAAMTQEEFCGRPAHIDGIGNLTVQGS